MKVSVIVPVYNVEKYLHQCVDSVLGQTYQDLEVILVDDGSTDGCPAICDKYARMDSRVRVIHQENGGLSAARNTGIEHITGEYVMFLDSDDYWMQDTALEIITNRLRMTDADVLCFSYAKCSESGQIISNRFEEIPSRPVACTQESQQLDFMFGHSVYIASAWNKAIKKNIVVEHPFEVGKTSEDIVWCAQLLRDATSFDFISNSLYGYRQREDSITHNYSMKRCEDLCENVAICISIVNETAEPLKKYLYTYTAYQYATFFAVQAFCAQINKHCLSTMKEFGWILKYHGESSKVKSIERAYRVLGFEALCALLRKTRKIWNRG